MKKAKKYLGRALRLLIMSGLLYWVFVKYIDTDVLLANLSELSYLTILAAFLFQGLRKFIMAGQVQFGLAPFGLRMSIHKVFGIQAISGLLGSLLPGGIAGGGVSWYMFSRQSGLRAQVGATLVLLQLLNLIIMMPFALLGLYLEPKLITFHLHYFIALFVLLTVAFFLLFAWRAYMRWAEKASKQALRAIGLKRLEQNLDNLWHAVEQVYSFRKSYIWLAFLWAFFIQLTNVAYFALIAYLLDMQVSIWVFFWLSSVLGILALLPISFMNIGVRELSLVYFLKFYGVLPERALLFSFVLLLVMLLYKGVGGLYFAFMKLDKPTADTKDI